MDETIDKSLPEKKEEVKSDNLTEIKGIGKKTSDILNGLGVFTFEQLSNIGVEELNSMLKEVGASSLNPKTWPKQAKDLVYKEESIK